LLGPATSLFNGCFRARFAPASQGLTAAKICMTITHSPGNTLLSQHQRGDQAYWL